MLYQLHELRSIELQGFYELLIERDVEGSYHGLFQYTAPEFAGKGAQKTHEKVTQNS
jgi:hypothetical protein